MTRAVIPRLSVATSRRAAERAEPSERAAFSLLEVIIATAVMAGSAMVLMSLLGLGTRFGSRAEQQTFAYSYAQTVLDEYLATSDRDTSQAEVTGVRMEPWPLSYRVIAEPLRADGNAASAPMSGVLRISVEVYETSGREGDVSGRLLCRLTRLEREPLADALEQTLESGDGEFNAAGSSAASPLPTSSQPLGGAF